MKKPGLLYIAIISAILLSCNKEDSWDCVKSTGKIVQERRIVKGVYYIFVEDNIDLIFKNNLGDTLVVEAGDNLLKKITSDNDGINLRIRNTNTCNWVRSYKKDIKVYIDAVKYKDIFVMGYGTVSNEGVIQKDKLFLHNYSNADVNLNVDLEFLWIDMDKLANITINGKLHRLHAINLGSGQLKVNTPGCKYVSMSNKGPGMSYVYSDSAFYSTIEGTGNVYYSGNPQIVTIYKQGAGEFIKQ
ncbi:MAG: DUF2807 domain-containing protein [Sporocytophaga sp.]|uniref:GIN domain-containing protein n=1 Tax=Sporocytophaga sp. TaxID=2231183 RepID=UPI001B17891F|nr:DUF2807 domain-containing protein [Sporocytophaga sp.]MBO9701230.1 DUF2807 domain-containing protein [Sporocytophaga sp.]